MYDAIWNFFRDNGYQPHGYCLLWRPEVFWTHVISDLVIALSYLSIPVVLWHLARKRPDMKYGRVLYLFAAFIVACAVTHVFGIWTMWVPVYGAEAVSKVITAVVSAMVAVGLWPLLPKLLAIPSQAALEEKNAALALEVQDRRAAEVRASALVANLERSNSELDTFAYVASHDLKSPLRAIDNAARWLEEDLADHLTDDTRENFDLIHGRISRMSKLLDDLLAHSRIGRREENRAPMTGRQILDEVLALTEVPAGFVLDLSPDLDQITLPKMPAHLILLNLVSNAIKHHDRDDGRISISVERVAEGLCFSVSDDGPGIEPAFHDQVFDLFRTLKPRDEVEGSGMGLAMVKKYVELEGGAISLVSDGTRGATFSFTLPDPPAADAETSAAA